MAKENKKGERIPQRQPSKEREMKMGNHSYQDQMACVYQIKSLPEIAINIKIIMRKIGYLYARKVIILCVLG